MKNISYRIALGGIMSAICLICMFCAGIFPALYLALPMIAGVIMVIIADEVNISWGFLTYLVVSILSLFITFDKEASLIFIMFFGHYPLLRIYLNKIKITIFRRIIKFAIYNICILAYFYSTVYLLGLTEMLDEINGWGEKGGIIMLAFVNVFFAAYDFNIDGFMNIYRKKIKKHIKARSR